MAHFAVREWYTLTWVGAQNLKKPADSSDWRQKL